VQDVEALQDLVVRVIPPCGGALLVSVATVAVMWYILPAAGLIVAGGLLTAGVAVPWISNRLARWREGRLAAARGELSTHVVDLVEGAQELVAFGCVERQQARVTAADAELTRIATFTSRVAGVGAALVTFVGGATVWGILLVGVQAVRSGRLSGPFLAVIALTPLAAFEVVAGLPAAAQSLVRVRHSAARVLEVIEARPPVEDPEVARPTPPGPPHIKVRGLRARYGSSGPWALDGIDLDLAPGRRIGIIGRSGAGKSTLAAVLTRLLAYESGSVTLNDVELSDLAGDDVRRVVGGVGQDTHVFDNTLRENLLLARRDAGDAAVNAALGRARLQGWVDRLEKGLDTEVGGDGGRMSGGQRQRLGIARALLADFPVLILDEPGEHLDTATADALTADVVDLTEGRTTIMITHRLVGLEAMDEILVLDRGMVVERGTHATLIAAGGPYAEQWTRERHLELESAIRP
jgi:thiol reductant ABC exporter CydC subunit